MFFKSKRFIQPDGTFDSTLFLKLLNDSRTALKTGKQVGHFSKKTTQPVIL